VKHAYKAPWSKKGRIIGSEADGERGVRTEKKAMPTVLARACVCLSDDRSEVRGLGAEEHSSALVLDMVRPRELETSRWASMEREGGGVAPESQARYQILVKRAL
jgi:hypothetical protein